MDTLATKYKPHMTADLPNNDELQKLLWYHKERYTHQYKDTLDTSSISVCRRHPTSNAVEFDFPRPLGFLDGYSQLKQFAALGSNVASLSDYVAYQWASGQALCTYKWLVRIKASDIQGSIETAIYQEVLRESDKLITFLTREDILNDITSSFILILEGDTSDTPSGWNITTFKKINNIVLVAQPNSTFHTHVVQLLRPEVVHFQVSTKECEHREGGNPTVVTQVSVDFDNSSTEHTTSLSYNIVWVIYHTLLQNEHEKKNKPSEQTKCANLNCERADNYAIITDKVEYIGLHSEYLLRSKGLPLSQEETNKPDSVQESSEEECVVSEEETISKLEVVKMMYNLYISGDATEMSDTSPASSEQDESCAEVGPRIPDPTVTMTTPLSDEVLEAVCDTLSLQENWPDDFEGMYVEDGKIIIDVLKGGISQMKNFLFRGCQHIFETESILSEQVVEFVEQEERAQYCVRRGSTICNIPDKEAFHKVMSSSDIRGIACIQKVCGKPEKPHDQPYGTVACVSEMTFEHQHLPASALFLLTARHIFEHNVEGIGHQNLAGTRKCKYFCENDGKMNYIAEESYGILGGSSDGNKGVDISVIPIKAKEPKAKEPTTDGACADFRPIPKVYDGPSKDLLDRKVEKLGATTPYSTGYICKTNYMARIGSQPRGECILVLSDGKTDTFSKRGDSGSLVISREKEPIEAIGLISKDTKDWRNRQGQREPATIVVLLKNCLDALENEFSTKLQLCGVWEECSVSPLPIPDDTPRPSPNMSSVRPLPIPDDTPRPSPNMSSVSVNDRKA